MNILKVDNWGDLPENYTGIVDFGISIVYFLNGLQHREDGPAIIWNDGAISYFLKGKRHREDGPAMIYEDGYKYWYINGNNITKKVNKWLNGKTNIPPYKKWDNNTRLIFKLTFG